jgi:hypothetical protein
MCKNYFSRRRWIINRKVYKGFHMTMTKRRGDKMEKRKLSIALISVTAILAVTLVTATPLASKTPLYTYRMENASSKMNFLPTTMNSFIYTAEKGYTVNYSNLECSECGGGASPLVLTCSTCDLDVCYETVCPTCPDTCPYTCGGGNTCSSTCPATCPATCITTCSGTTCSATSCPDKCPWTEWPDCFYTAVYPTCYWETCVWC